MIPVEILALCLILAGVAALYASVGHGGASGYLAVMSLALLDPALMSSTALVLNVVVAGISALQFSGAGHFSWQRTWPFIVLSIPFSFVGGVLTVSDMLYFLMLAGVLLFASYRLLAGSATLTDEPSTTPPRMVAVGSGGAIGLLSGIVGVGGGIFLSPIMVLLKWATTKQTAAVSAFFIVVNSLAGLAGRYVRGGIEIGTIWPLVVAAAAGGLAGSFWGAKRSTPRALRQLLGVVLLIAVIKLILTTFS